MEFRLLGPLEVRDGEALVAVGGGKRRSLLALLLLHPAEVVPAERLIDELWSGRPPPTAAKSLQVHMSQLRRDLARADGGRNGGVLVTRGNGYVATVDPADVDVHRFERLAARGRRVLRAGELAAASERLRAALALWRGPALLDFAYEAFAQGDIARLEEERLEVLEDCADAELALGRHGELVGELQALVRAHPYRERPRTQLMLALYRGGRQADALQAYREGRAELASELGLEPGPSLRELEADPHPRSGAAAHAAGRRRADAVEARRPAGRGGRRRSPAAGDDAADRSGRRPRRAGAGCAGRRARRPRGSTRRAGCSRPAPRRRGGSRAVGRAPGSPRPRAPPPPPRARPPP